MNIERAFCETSSETIKGKDLGVALLLAAEKADSMDPTAKMAITSMLAEIVFNSTSMESSSISGTISSKKLLSAM